MSVVSGPSAVPTRLLAPDLARGFMLLLIAMAYASVYVGAGFSADASREDLLDRAAAFATTLLLDNRAFSMFAILFGYGVAWMVARQSARGTPVPEIRRLLRRRGLWLLVFGLVHALVLFPYEVLASYGFATLLTGWLLLRSNRAIDRAIVAFALLSAITVPAAMVQFSLAPDGALVMPGYLTRQDWVDRTVPLPFFPPIVAIAYPLLLLVALGYRAGRAGLLDDPVKHRTLLKWIAAIGVTVSVAGALPLALAVVGVLSPEPATRGLVMGLQVMTGVFGGAGYAALFTLWAIRLERTRGPLTRAVAAVGQRSLTCYLLNSALVAIVLHPDLVGFGPRLGVFGALIVGLMAWLVSLIVAAWLQRAGRPGPADALLRSLVHRDRPQVDRALG